MGTRNLTAVKINGEYKVAKYGQWDGHPSSMGVELLEFLSGNEPSFFEDFKNKVRQLTYFTHEELEEIDKIENWPEKYPHLSRDNAGALILEFIINGVNKIHNKLDFAADSVFCEWAYVIDFDLGTFEVFEGFNKIPLSEDDRFYFLEEKARDGYHPVRLVATFQLDSLPTEEEFLKILEKDEESD